jgi:hypothetical protein
MVTGTRKKLRGGLPLFVTFGLIVLGPSRIYSQVVGATLSGTVTDQSGAVKPSDVPHAFSFERRREMVLPQELVHIARSPQAILP